jgi:hypothetical protein
MPQHWDCPEMTSNREFSLQDHVQIIRGRYQGYCGIIVAFSESHKLCTLDIESKVSTKQQNAIKTEASAAATTTTNTNTKIPKTVRVRSNSIQLWNPNCSTSSSTSSRIDPEFTTSNSTTLPNSTIKTDLQQKRKVVTSITSSSSSKSIQQGPSVKIIGGNYQGSIGYVLGMQGVKTYRIQIPTPSNPSDWMVVSKRITSLEFLPDNTTVDHKFTHSYPAHTTCHKLPSQMQYLPTCRIKNSFSPSVHGSSIAPEYTPERRRQSTNVNRTFSVPSQISDTPYYDTPTSNTSRKFNLIAGDEWNIPDSHRCGITFGRCYVTSRRLADTPTNTDATFLTSLFQSRIQIVDIPIRIQQPWIPMEQELYDHGTNSRLQLISTKLCSDATVSHGGFRIQQPKVLRCMYLAETFPDCQTISAEEELQKLANFAALPTRKAMARLQLLQSPAYMVPTTTRHDCKKMHGIFFFPRASDICTQMVNDPGCAGCGFIAESLLMDMFDSLGKKSLAKKVFAIQVRLFVPTMGIYKGMLCRKRNITPPIQLVESMYKVPPSTLPNASPGLALILCRNGVYPKPGTTNDYIGRRLDASAKCPLRLQSFQPKPLSDMILRLFQAVQVHPDTIRTYKTQSCTREGVNHAWLVGLADPTNRLPVGHVLVTGKLQVSSTRVFITRSPCMKPTDGRVLPVVQQKPDAMSLEDWNFLQSFPFGGIIFAFPSSSSSSSREKRGMCPIPEYIANGDLDGDLYFTCWDANILQEVQTEPILADQPVTTKSSCTTSFDSTCVISQPHWFQSVQALMMNVPLLVAMEELTSKCYRLSQRIADQHPDCFMNHPDAIAMAMAYTQALEYTKHGGQIYLPNHLHHLIPQHLHSYITDSLAVG